MQLEVIEILTYSLLCTLLCLKGLLEFSKKSQHQAVVNSALKLTSVSVSSDVYKQMFSVINFGKSKLRKNDYANKHLQPVVRVACSLFSPDIKQLASTKKWKIIQMMRDDQCNIMYIVTQLKGQLNCNLNRVWLSGKTGDHWERFSGLPDPSPLVADQLP